MVRAVTAIYAGLQVDLAYYDYKKAFDSVDSNILLIPVTVRGKPVFPFDVPHSVCDVYDRI